MFRMAQTSHTAHSELGSLLHIMVGRDERAIFTECDNRMDVATVGEIVTEFDTQTRGVEMEREDAGTDIAFEVKDDDEASSESEEGAETTLL